MLRRIKSSVFWLSIYKALVFLGSEFRRNLISFLLPLPVFLFAAVYMRLTGANGAQLGTTGIWGYLVFFAILAMVYGLQCFSSEADRKTLDFILSRPISPFMILTVKYLSSIAVFLGWLAAAIPLLKPDLKKLPLMPGMGQEWILLIFLVIHGMSFFAGLLAKGLERFFVVSFLSALMGWLCYHIWNMAFSLMSSNYYWFDIPPRLHDFVARGIPLYLACLSLAAPLVGTLWFLRSRTRPWQYKPIRRLAGVWAATYIMVLLAQRLFSPPVWPDINAVCGDWHEKGGIVLVSAVKTGKKTQENAGGPKRQNSRLSIGPLGGRQKTYYTGVNIKKPRFSPGGDMVVFSEDGQLRLLKIRERKVVKLGPGDIASWSHDGKRLIFAHIIGRNGLSRIYELNLENYQKVQVTEEEFNLADLAWDSINHKLYMVGYLHTISCLDLDTMRKYNFKADEALNKVVLGVVNPSTVLSMEDGRLFIGVIYARKLQIFALDLKTGDITLTEDKLDIRLQTGAPLLIHNKFKAFIWPRIDGSFEYQGTYFYAVKEHIRIHGRRHGHADDHQQHVPSGKWEREH